jgi:hypothetical protein
MVGDNKKKDKTRQNSVKIEAYLKPSWVLASTNKTQLGFSLDQYLKPSWVLASTKGVYNPPSNVYFMNIAKHTLCNPQ